MSPALGYSLGSVKARRRRRDPHLFLGRDDGSAPRRSSEEIALIVALAARVIVGDREAGRAIGLLIDMSLSQLHGHSGLRAARRERVRFGWIRQRYSGHASEPLPPQANADPPLSALAGHSCWPGTPGPTADSWASDCLRSIGQ